MRGLIDALIEGIEAHLSAQPGGQDLIPGSEFLRPSPFVRRLRLDVPRQTVDAGDGEDGYDGEI